MNRQEYTEIGGPAQGFHTTQWTELLGIRSKDDEKRRLLLNDLFQKYWKPVYCYVRRKGHQSEDAKDLTQDFMREIIMEGPLIERADKNKGRFRTFLLKNLDFYLANKYQYQKAKKRSPEGLVSIDHDPEATMDLPDQTVSPNEAFHLAWARELLLTVYTDVEKSCRESGKEIHWQVFQKKVLVPILDGTPVPSLSVICSELGIEQEAQASNMIKTVKRVFRTQMLKHLRQQVESESEVEEEFNDIMGLFVKK